MVDISAKEEIIMNKKDKKRLIVELLKSEEIKGIYENYIVQEIPFETWVRNMTDYLLKTPKPLITLKKISHKECIACKCADATITYSDWWYCKNPEDFRDFTVLRDKCHQRPRWCPHK